MQTNWKKAAGLLASAGMAVTGVVASGGSASAAPSGTATTTTTTLPYVCQTRVSGSWIPVDYSRTFTVTAPATVAPYKTFKVTFDSAPINAVAAYNKTLTDVRIAYRVPAGTTVLDYRLTGGSSNLGGGQWIERHGDTLVVRSDDAFQGGVEYDLPNLEVVMRAPGSGTLTTTAGGTGFDDPSFYWYRLQPTTNEWDPFQCYADPAQPVTFSTTKVQP
ncbi:hypothetical protein ACF061_27735 [Streptomyces sp. NPDC015220]|uniref:hypothetical protein n=1 Tax=Streptomyces sp. NPDC015220 TaxID=3364947 RepID=UPI0036FB0527